MSQSDLNHSVKKGELNLTFFKIKKINSFPIKNRTRVLFSCYNSESAYNKAPESDADVISFSMDYKKRESDIISEAQKQIDERKEADVETSIDEG